VRSGVVQRLAGRDRNTEAPVPLYTRTNPPWHVKRGWETNIDASCAWGDVDGDEALTAADIALAIRMAAGVIDSLPAADVWPESGDGVVDLNDAIVLCRTLAS
jgi:hypothetical protein